MRERMRRQAVKAAQNTIGSRSQRKCWATTKNAIASAARRARRSDVRPAPELCAALAASTRSLARWLGIGRDTEHADGRGVAGNVVAAVLCAAGGVPGRGIRYGRSSSRLDLLDGALASATDRATDFGSVFDAVMDRVSEAAVLFGLLIWFSDRGERTEELLIFVAVVGSILVSYVRARAEIIGAQDARRPLHPGGARRAPGRSRLSRASWCGTEIMALRSGYWRF